MSDEQKTQHALHPETGDAKPVELEGEIWAPPVEDDAEAALKPKGTIFLGADGLRAGWSAALFFLILIGITTTISLVLHATHIAPPRPVVVDGVRYVLPSITLFSHLLILVGSLLAAWVMSLIEKRSLANYGLALPSTHRLRQWVIGFGWGILLLSVLVGVLKLTGLLVFTGVATQGSAALVYAIKWLAGMILVGLTEEFLLRGYLQYTLARGLGALQGHKVRGFWVAAVILSLVFGLTHMGNKGESHFGLVSAGLAGFVLCISLWRTGSLWWGIGWHAGWNFAQSYLYGVGDSGTLSYGHLLGSHPAGSEVWSGGTVGPEGSLLVLPALALTALVMHTTIRKEEWPAERG